MDLCIRFALVLYTGWSGSLWLQGDVLSNMVCIDSATDVKPVAGYYVQRYTLLDESDRRI